jgi:hypothetical protein
MLLNNFTFPPVVRRFLLIVPAMIAGFGIQNLYVYFTNTKPVEVSIEQLISDPPRAKWVRVTGGRINLIDAAASEAGFKKKIDRVYVPIHPEGKEEAAVSVLLLSTHPELLALARQFHALDEAKDGEMEGLKLAMQNADLILQKRPFEGLIQSGLSQDDRVTYDIRKALPNIVKEPIIIEEGKKPSMLEGLGILLLAFLTLVGVLSVPKSKGATPPPLPPSPPPLPRNA